MGLEVDVDRDLCIGSGNCVYEAAGVFAAEDVVVAAARKCPSHAISVRRDGITLV
jgi:ferredoxin